MKTEAQLKRIQTKLQQLLKDYSVLQKENIQLKTELHHEKVDVAIQQTAIDNLKQQVDVLKYANGDLSGADKKDFEKKINSYLREIDRCIAMLSQ